MADKIKKLSDAIRLGATFHPQCKQSFSAWDNGRVTATCALGAAMEAVGLLNKQSICLDAVQKRFPDVPLVYLHCVISYNDDPRYYWSRETIANWLDEQGY